MNRFTNAAVVGGAVLAVAVLPAAGLASAAVTPTPIPVPVSPTATATPTPAPVHHKTHHRKPTSGHHKKTKKRHRTPVVHDPVVQQPVVHPPIATTQAPVPSTQSSPSIIGGQNADDAPWAAQVSWNDTGFACSGTVIAPQWVLTAGHCANTDGMSVLIGSPQLGQGTEDQVDKATVDPDGDLALLHLADPAQTTFAKLADQDPKVGDTNEIYGWGMTSTNSGPAQQLKMAKVKVTSVNCQDAAGGKAICSSAVTGAAFHGDSGGPEMADGTEVGVCSTGDEQARTQEYASVAANRDWIHQVANV
jgi:secreted trypsin-like serine protease